MVLAFLPLLVFGLFFLSLIVFGSTLATNNYGGLLLTIVVMALLYLAQMVKSWQHANPVALIGDNMKILVNSDALTKLDAGHGHCRRCCRCFIFRGDQAAGSKKALKN